MRFGADDESDPAWVAANAEAVAKFEFAANSGIGHSFTTPWFSGEDAADLLITTSAGNHQLRLGR